MSFLDSLSSTVNRGTAAAGRKAEQLKLNNQMNGLNRRRRELAAQLGASLFDVIRQDPVLLEGREDIVSEMEAIDLQRVELEGRLASLEAEAQAAEVLRCAKCGAPIHASDRFCGSCGAPAAEAMPQRSAARPAAADGPTCPSCGSPIEPGDTFCMTCGARLAGDAIVTVEEEVSTESFDGGPRDYEG